LLAPRSPARAGDRAGTAARPGPSSRQPAARVEPARTKTLHTRLDDRATREVGDAETLAELGTSIKAQLSDIDPRSSLSIPRRSSSSVIAVLSAVSPAARDGAEAELIRTRYANPTPRLPGVGHYLVPSVAGEHVDRAPPQRMALAAGGVGAVPVLRKLMRVFPQG
jgi:hypothetical protein